jgi:3-(3-hydroxy-phenyl)propionate hydroxylase
MDFQMGPDTDLEYVSRHDVAAERVRRQLGHDVEFELVWVGPYSYRAQLIEKLREGRTFFLGDSAHAMSPFGARGGNSGIQDADNLGWKFALVLAGHAPASLLDSYHAERRPAAQFNIMTTRRTARYLQPESPAEKILRDAAISLAKEYPFARHLCNTGRLSNSFIYGKPPSSKAQKHKVHGVDVGEAVQNVEITAPDGRRMALVDLFRGNASFIGFWSGSPATLSRGIVQLANRLVADGRGTPLLRMLEVNTGKTGLSIVRDHAGKLAATLGLSKGKPVFCLLRPDMHLAARIEHPNVAKVKAALRHALEGKP